MVAVSGFDRFPVVPPVEAEPLWESAAALVAAVAVAYEIPAALAGLELVRVLDAVVAEPAQVRGQLPYRVNAAVLLVAGPVGFLAELAQVRAPSVFLSALVRVCWMTLARNLALSVWPVVARSPGPKAWCFLMFAFPAVSYLELEPW